MIRDLTNIDDDIVRKKRIIGKMLYEDADIIEMLNDPSIDPSYPSDAMYSSVFPFIRVPDTQDVAKNYITFAIDDSNLMANNSAIKDQYVKFVIFVHKDLVKTNYDIPRHDILAYMIRDIFHLSNKLGLQAVLVSNNEGVTDTNYYTRTLRFRIITPNSVKPFQTNPYEIDSILGHRG